MILPVVSLQLLLNFVSTLSRIWDLGTHLAHRVGYTTLPTLCICHSCNSYHLTFEIALRIGTLFRQLLDRFQLLPYRNTLKKMHLLWRFLCLDHKLQGSYLNPL